MTSINDVSVNLKTIENAMQKLPSSTRLFCLPENSLFLNLGTDPIPSEKAFTKDSPEIRHLRDLAEDKNIFLHMGGIAWEKDGKVYNEALLLTPDGEIVETYEKIHLFDVDLGPGIQVTESRSYRSGHRLNVFEVDGWRIATAICYDVRFPEIFVHYMETENVDLFLVPAAFTTKTGKIHWKPLLRARAIETQAYVVAPAQVGYHREPGSDKLRKTWGQSLVISPWGKILQETPSFSAFLDSDLTEHDPIHSVLEREEIESYRKSIPISQHRRFAMELKQK
ncbi:MAG: carbon-nitrogen hydrolase family protein [Bdellovibrionales bacterium]|nr:carbon-nitrogen hydrolase family protein [Bdellovibrionales bacterium]